MTNLWLAGIIAFASAGYGIAIYRARSQAPQSIVGFLGQTKPQHWIVVAVLIWAVTSGMSGYKEKPAKDMLVSQFHLPNSIEFTEIRAPRRGTANHIEGIVQFTEAQMATYRAQFADRNVWKPVEFELNRREFTSPYSSRALKWHALPKPIFAGTKRVRWGNLARDKVRSVKRGRALCIALRVKQGSRQAKRWREAPKGYEDRFPLKTPSNLDKFNAVHCAELGRSENPAAFILGLLDFETRNLHMIIR